MRHVFVPGAVGVLQDAGGPDKSLLRIGSYRDGVYTRMPRGLNGDCHSIAFDEDDNLYAGGEFMTADGVVAKRIAKWDGDIWSPLGAGFQGVSGGGATVYAISDDLTGKIYAGGDFRELGDGTDFRWIGEWDWDVSSWVPMVGLNGTAYAIFVDATNTIYAGGAFPAFSPTNNVRRAIWNDDLGGYWSWQVLSGGPGSWNGLCFTLTGDLDDNLYAGGSFTIIDGNTVNRIAKWDGSSWSALGTGLNGTCREIAFDSGGNLYAGGEFTTAGGVTVNRIAKWDGSSWSALGAGLNNTCMAIAFDSDGNLYAGGEFTTAGGVTANRIAKWSGTSWSNLGDGLNGNVFSLAFDSTDTLFIGGAFTAYL